MVASGVRRLYKKAYPYEQRLSLLANVATVALRMTRVDEMFPSLIWAVAGEALLGQNTLCGSMYSFAVWLSEGFYLDPHLIVPISQLSAPHLPVQRAVTEIVLD
jgi:hypothetical protein